MYKERKPGQQIYVGEVKLNKSRPFQMSVAKRCLNVMLHSTIWHCDFLRDILDSGSQKCLKALISDHEISFEIKHTIKHNFRLKLGKS